MNICHECHWCDVVTFSDGSDSSKCHCPSIPRVTNPVTGTIERKYDYCAALRRGENLCGPEGKWFVPDGEYVPDEPREDEECFRGTEAASYMAEQQEKIYRTLK